MWGDDRRSRCAIISTAAWRRSIGTISLSGKFANLKKQSTGLSPSFSILRDSSNSLGTMLLKRRKIGTNGACVSSGMDLQTYVN